jgi:hypothetical protein
MNPSLLDHFASTAPTFDLSETITRKLCGRMPEEPLEQLKWKMQLEAKIRFIYASAMMEESKRHKKPSYGKCPVCHHWKSPDKECKSCSEIKRAMSQQLIPQEEPEHVKAKPKDGNRAHR